MSTASRIKVLQCFKSLHRTKDKVFQGDDLAISAARKQINEEFKKFKNVDNATGIEELIRFSLEVERELKTTVIQAKEVIPGVYRAEIGNDTLRLDNVPYNEEACDNKKNAKNKSHVETNTSCK